MLSSTASLCICLVWRSFVFYIMKSLIQERILLGAVKKKSKKRMFLSYFCILLITSFSEAKCNIV